MKERISITQGKPLTEVWPLIGQYLNLYDGSAVEAFDATSGSIVTISRMQNGALWVERKSGSFQFGGTQDMRGALIYVTDDVLSAMQQQYHTFRAESRLAGVSNEASVAPAEKKELSFAERIELYLEVIESDELSDVCIHKSKLPSGRTEYVFSFATDGLDDEAPALSIDQRLADLMCTLRHDSKIARFSPSTNILKNFKLQTARTHFNELAYIYYMISDFQSLPRDEAQALFLRLHYLMEKKHQQLDVAGLDFLREELATHFYRKDAKIEIEIYADTSPLIRPETVGLGPEHFSLDVFDYGITFGMPVHKK